MEGEIRPRVDSLKTGGLVGVVAGGQPAAMNDSKSQVGWRTRGLCLRRGTYSLLPSALSSTSSRMEMAALWTGAGHR